METQALLLKYCARTLSAREVAGKNNILNTISIRWLISQIDLNVLLLHLIDKCIITMADAFPQIAWNKQCLQTLLDLVEAVGKSCNLVMVVSNHYLSFGISFFVYIIYYRF